MLTIPYLGGFALMIMGLHCLAVRHHLVKTVIGMVLMQYGLTLLLAAAGYPADRFLEGLGVLVIVLGGCTTAVALGLCRLLYRRYGTMDTRRLGRGQG